MAIFKFWYSRMFLFDYLYILCLHQYGGGEVAFLEVDEETLGFAAALVHQAALQTVEATADDAYLFAVKPGGDFVVAVVFYVFGAFHCVPEGFKVRVTHTHGLKLLAAAHVAVLQQSNLADDGVKLFTGLMHKNEVGHVGHVTHYPFAKFGEHVLLEGDEYAILHLWNCLQLLVGGILGVRTGQIAQHVPTVF